MEKKSKLWLWILIGVLCLGAIGGGVWLGLSKPTVEELRSEGVFVLRKDDLEEGEIVEGTDMLVVARRWDSKSLVLSFSYKNQAKDIQIDFSKTTIVLKVPNPEGDGLINHNLLSMSSPYWEDAFCSGDTLVFRLRDSSVGLKKNLTLIESEDVVKITNLGPSKCRKVN